MLDHEWNGDKCSIILITYNYRRQLEERIVEDITRMIKSFYPEMKKRFRILASLAEKYKDEICFMVEIDVTCMEVVEPRVNFIDPMGYEMLEELIEGYAKIVLESEKDNEYPR